MSHIHGVRSFVAYTPVTVKKLWSPVQFAGNTLSTAVSPKKMSIDCNFEKILDILYYYKLLPSARRDAKLLDSIECYQTVREHVEAPKKENQAHIKQLEHVLDHLSPRAKKFPIYAVLLYEAGFNDFLSKNYVRAVQRLQEVVVLPQTKQLEQSQMYREKYMSLYMALGIALIEQRNYEQAFGYLQKSYLLQKQMNISLQLKHLKSFKLVEQAIECIQKGIEQKATDQNSSDWISPFKQAEKFLNAVSHRVIPIVHGLKLIVKAYQEEPQAAQSSTKKNPVTPCY